MIPFSSEGDYEKVYSAHLQLTEIWFGPDYGAFLLCLGFQTDENPNIRLHVNVAPKHSQRLTKALNTRVS